MALSGNVTFEDTVSYLEYVTNGPYFSVFKPGVYLFEVWGAQGGCLNGCSSSKGGYSRGVLYLRKNTKIFINIGQTGCCVKTPSTETSESYNGGGKGKTSGQSTYISCAGGGATDIRIKENTLFHRILVAGGGGGDTYYNSFKTGGYGGGLKGGDASERCELSSYGGEQEKGGKGIKGVLRLMFFSM